MFVADNCNALFHARRIRGKIGWMDDNRKCMRVIGLVLVVTLCIFGSPREVFADEVSVKATAEVAAFPDLPEVNLARPRAIEGDANPFEYWGGRSEALILAAEAIESPLEKSRSLLAAANIIIGRQTEPFCSLAVLNVVAEPSASDKTAIGTSLDRAEKLIQQAGDLLKAHILPEEVPADGPAEDRSRLEKLKADHAHLVHGAEVLQSFLDGQRIYLLGESEPGTRRRAASALAPLLEDSEKKVAGAARLWQALLRGMESDPTAVLHILGSPMNPPHPETWPYGLFARVLRCRYQGGESSWSSALVMLVHFEEQLEEWVPEVVHRGDARRYFAYARLEVLRRWYDSLPPEREAERAWCAGQAHEIVKVYFSVEQSLLRLEPAVPMIFADEAYNAGGAKADPQ